MTIMKTGFLEVVALISAPWIVDAYPHFADQIPNGKLVPNPNPQGGIWAGVGHEKAGGGGPLNPFGEAFRENGFVWTDELCRTDSDGDGRTNGEELGDPECLWFAGGPDPTLPSLSHPGVVDSPADEPPSSSCSSYEEPDTVYEFDIKFTQPTLIDETRTHYICEQIEQPVPSSEVLHKIKDSVLLNNSDVLHHMFVFVCFEDSLDGNRVGEGPYECSGNESRCVRVAGWAVGPEESCTPSHIGEEIDFTGLQNVVVKIEAHYDNASGRKQQDQSGIRVVLTPELRPLTAAASVLGTMTIDNNFLLPPQESSYPLTNICPSESTAKLPHPLYVYAFGPHMHLFGRSLYTEHYRCGKKIGEIGRINSYEFDNQQNYFLPKPVKILPGDAMVTTCEYDTTSSDVALVGGEETTDEMCLNFIRYYPALEDTSFRACTSFENGFDAEMRPNARLGGAQSSLLASRRFAIGGGPGLEGLALEFDSDPANSWAPCCETNTCEGEYVEASGGVCALDNDCSGELVCEQGFCAEAPTNLVEEGIDPPNSKVDSGAPDNESERSDTPSGANFVSSLFGTIFICVASLLAK